MPIKEFLNQIIRSFVVIKDTFRTITSLYWSLTETSLTLNIKVTVIWAWLRAWAKRVVWVRWCFCSKMSLISYKSSGRESKKGFADTGKKLCLFLFYLSLDIKDLLSLSLEGLILSELYIFNGYSLREFSLYYLY